jgi:hypothetical protein
VKAAVPGLDARRLVALMREAVERCALDLSDLRVVTEAASGAYVVTPLIAALAGAERVTAFTRSTRYGTADEIRTATLELAARAGVPNRIDVLPEKSLDAFAQADIVTNSGHVRPLDAATLDAMRPGAVIALMYEAWEFRATDLDLAAARARGIRIAATNERHAAVDVFSYLGLLAVRLLLDAHVAPYRARVLLLCDNPFAPYVRRGLEGAGAIVDVAPDLASAPLAGTYDALVVSTTPTEQPALDADAAAEIARRWPGAVVGVLWGDVDRDVLHAAGVPCWPPAAPARGHMSLLLSDLGPEPIVRLQSGSLRAAEAVFRHGNAAAATGTDPLAAARPTPDVVRRALEFAELL